MALAIQCVSGSTSTAPTTTSSPTHWTPWKTIQIDLWADFKECKRVMDKHDHHICTDEVNNPGSILKEAVFRKSGRILRQDFVKVSLEDLGYTTEPSYERFCRRGIALGLELCEPTDAAAVLLQLRGKRPDNHLTLAMKIMENLHGYPAVLGLCVVKGLNKHITIDNWHSRPTAFARREYLFRLPRNS